MSILNSLQHPDLQTLPIFDVFADLIKALEAGDELVLQAPPGAGKTTCVPLYCLQMESLHEQKILMLEPRRLAARAAAVRMADILGEKVGETVGYRVRMETKASKKTRIEVVTEGILTRMLQDDPSLAGVGMVIFDEFHERSLDADFGLALTLQARKLFRQPEEGEMPLKVIVMSATLDDHGVEELLGRQDKTSEDKTCQARAPLIQSTGRQFPVDIVYGDPWKVGEDVPARTVKTLQDILECESGSVLVFLPGRREIKRVENQLKETLSERQLSTLVISPLYGDMTLESQRSAILPSPEGYRKIVLATSIAESSLTIEGVRVVLDAGLSRQAAFDPKTGMTRLRTERVSKASSIQRAGRAGRTEPGKCYRLWSETQQSQLTPFAKPEIRQADLSSLLLQALSWGVDELEQLDWLDSPPSAHIKQAIDILLMLGAVEDKNASEDKSAIEDNSAAYGYEETPRLVQLTQHGESMAQFPAHPRLAHMLLKSREIDSKVDAIKLSSQLAALLSERDPLNASDGADIELRLDLLEQRSSRTKRLDKIIIQFQQALLRSESKPDSSIKTSLQRQNVCAYLLALAYPDRIAIRRSGRRSDKSNDYVLSNRRAAYLLEGDRLQSSEALVICQLGGRDKTRRDQIFLASSLDLGLFEDSLAELVTINTRVEWDDVDQRFKAEEQRKVGALVLSSRKLDNVDHDQKQVVLSELVRKKGLDLLNWTPDLNQWRSRVRFLFQHIGSPWPDLSDEVLLETIPTWLGPFLTSVNHIDDFKKVDLKSALLGLLAWPLPKDLDELAPTHIAVPSGRSVRLDYRHLGNTNLDSKGNAPVLALKLQEMLGATNNPAILNGRIPVAVHLLSPAKRPLAITQDLQSFWQNVYPEVKKEMKGRYPKHFWPDDPLTAAASSNTTKKARST